MIDHSSQYAKQLSNSIKIIAKEWRNISQNLVFDKQVLNHWNILTSSWIESNNIPLIIRSKKYPKGIEIIHETGRKIIPSDNSPALWIAEQILHKNEPTLDEIESCIHAMEIPFSFIQKKNTNLNLKYKTSCTYNKILTKKEWKLCHINNVGLNKKGDISKLNIEFLKGKSFNLINPYNFFLLPKTIGGLGEISYFIESLQEEE